MYLITGLEGLIASALIQNFLDSAKEITVLTRRCQDPALYPFRIIEADLLDPEQTKACLAGHTFSGVFHAAAAMDGVSASQFDGAGNYLNAAMTRNLLAALGKNSAEKIILISSIDVYDPAAFAQPVTEAASPGPVTHYGKSKLESERLIGQWAQVNNLPALILRVTQVFGERDRTRKFIPAVIKRIKADLPVDLFGNGEDLRDYIYSRDVARLALALCQENAAGVYNLATGTSRSLKEVLERIILISGREVEVRYHARNRERLDYRFANRKLTSLLPDFEFTDFDRALRETYDHIF